MNASVRCAAGRKQRAYDVVDTKDCPNVDTGVDVAAAVQGIEDDAVLPSVAVFNDNGLLVLFRDEDCGLSGGPEAVDHDVVG